MRLNLLLTSLASVVLYGCGTFSGNSYEEDVAYDREILNDIIKLNPVLDSAKEAGHYFLPYSSESGKITGDLDLHLLSLNDSNFRFPASIRNFRRVSKVLLSSNNFTDLPSGTRQKNWDRVVVWANKMCNPSQETVDYLDKLMDGYFGGYWRDSQRCNDSIPGVIP